MDFVPLLVTAFAFGFVARAMGLPPLAGYLVAGFVLHAAGYASSPALEAISEIGILLLLFGIGLKLQLRSLARPRVWATTVIHAAVTVSAVTGMLLALGALGLPLAADLDVTEALILGFAFSFSSTVFAVKSLERMNESASLAGTLAIGVLIVQDVFAVGFLAVADGFDPSIWALVVVPAVIALRPALGWVLDRSGHGEILILTGFTVALGVGAGLFDLVGLKPDLGALLAGLMLSGHPRAGEMADRLLAFKDLFLVGFFLSIGLAGTPSAASWIIGIILLVLVPVKSAGFFWLFTRFRLRARTSAQSALALSTYSEFGLIVTAAALGAGLLDEGWASTVAVAVALSFIAGATANTYRYRLFDRWRPHLSSFERRLIVPEDAIIDCGFARVLVFGMGRVGTGAYDEMVERSAGPVVGVDRREETVDAHRSEGRRMIRGDALDRDFWDRVTFNPQVRLVILAMNSHSANVASVEPIRQYLPNARIAAIARYPDQLAELHQAGVDVARNLYEEAGQALADDAVNVVLARET